MERCFRRDDPVRAYEDYVRALLIVERYGDHSAHRMFVQQHGDVLTGSASHLLRLGGDHLATVFADAARCKAGSYPKTLSGLRLALPKRLEPRLSDPWGVWRTFSEYEPGRAAFFCCPGCLSSFQSRFVVRQDAAS